MKKHGLRYLSKEAYTRLVAELCDYCSEKFIFCKKYDVRPFVPCDDCLESSVWILYREKVNKEKGKRFLLY